MPSKERASRTVKPLTDCQIVCEVPDSSVLLRELEAQRQQLGLEAETTTRNAQQNAVNNPPRVVDEQLGVEEIAPSHCQPLAPRGRAKYSAHLMYEENDLDLDRARAT
ncbi:hypothetical protein KY289_030281 [Solanum tuberosum]|nr:hypothetical protein KY289_030281 [Solanum tuberosum]